jgi:transcriptional regulator GlxA family with amidase domain
MSQQVRSPGSRRLQQIGRIARLQLFLSRSSADTPPLKELAAMARMSRSHFSRTFHAVAGVTVRDFIRDIQLQRAAALLRESPLSLTAIALECGFYDLPHLDKAFRRRFGLTPHRFRRQCLERARAAYR